MAPFFRNAAQSITGTAQFNIIKEISQKVYPGNYARMTNLLSAAFPIFGLFFPMLFGIVQGAAPVASYNYGAGETKRVKQATLFSFIYTLILGSVIWLLSSVILVEPLLTALGVEDDRTSAKKVIMILMLGAPLFAIAIAGMVLFSSTDRIAFSFISSTCRGFILFFPVIYTFRAIAIANPQYEYAFWWMFPTLSLTSVMVIGAMMIITLRRLDYKHTTLDERVEMVDKAIISFVEVRKTNKQAKRDLRNKQTIEKKSGKFSKEKLSKKHAIEKKELLKQLDNNKQKRIIENKKFKQKIKNEKNIANKKIDADNKIIKANKK